MVSRFLVGIAAVIMTSLSTSSVSAKSTSTMRHSANWPGTLTRHISTTGESIHVNQLNSTDLSGSYVSSNGRVLRFKSTCSGQVEVVRVDGSLVIGVGAVPSHPNIRYLSLQNTTFLYDVEGFVNEYQKRRLVDELRHLGGAHNVVDVSDPTVNISNYDIESLLSDIDSYMLASLSRSLGEIGIVGYSENCSLPLHLTALSLHKYKYRNVSIHGNHFTAHAQRQFPADERNRGASRDRRSCEEFPNADDECLGMCGYGCSCWKWVCNDCCFHQGCYEHDMCCRKSSFRCMFVHNFSCSEFTDCQ